MSALETYLKRVAETSGIEHMAAIAALRQYIRASTEDEIADFIVRITDINLLRYVIEAGVTSRLQNAVVKRYNTLKAEQGGE